MSSQTSSIFCTHFPCESVAVSPSCSHSPAHSHAIRASSRGELSALSRRAVRTAPARTELWSQSKHPPERRAEQTALSKQSTVPAGSFICSRKRWDTPPGRTRMCKPDQRTRRPCPERPGVPRAPNGIEGPGSARRGRNSPSSAAGAAGALRGGGRPLPPRPRPVAPRPSRPPSPAPRASAPRGPGPSAAPGKPGPSHRVLVLVGAGAQRQERQEQQEQPGRRHLGPRRPQQAPPRHRPAPAADATSAPPATSPARPPEPRGRYGSPAGRAEPGRDRGRGQGGLAPRAWDRAQPAGAPFLLEGIVIDISFWSTK